MQDSKHNFKRKLQKRDYNQNYHFIKMSYSDKHVKITIDRCDLCDDQLPQKEDNNDLNLETRMRIIDEIDESFESDYDKSTYEYGPKLLLCNYCKKEYLLPSYS